MAAIWKYKFTYTDLKSDGSFILGMPRDAKVLCVQLQDSVPAIWAKVDPNLATEARKFFLVGTGKPFPEGAGDYVGTYQDGPYVWHIYQADL